MQIINLIGHIGRDAETKHIGDRDYISFSVACTEKRGNEENTSWYSILYPYQESIMPFLKKGQQVFVMGRLSTKIYQANNNIGIDLSVFAQTIQLCGSKREELAPVPAGSATVPAGSSAGQPHTPASPAPVQSGSAALNTPPFPPAEASEDDLPF